MLHSKQTLEPISTADVHDFCQSSGDLWWFCLLKDISAESARQEALATTSNNSFYV